MNFFSRIKLAQKLPAIMIALTVLTIAVSNLVSYRNASSALLNEAKEGLLTVAESKSLELESWLDGLDIDLMSQAGNPTVLSAMRGFEEAWNALEGSQQDYLQKWYIETNPNDVGAKAALDFATDGSAYSQVHKLYHDYFRKLAHDKGYYDVFLFSRDGDLVYSVAKELDYATNFVKGTYSDSNLGDLVRDSLAATEIGVLFQDFAEYAPSNGAPASFMATPIVDRRGDVRGVLAIQLPSDRINAITTRPTGLGATGDSYLVGEDMLLRSDPIHSAGSNILSSSVTLDSVRLAIAGEKGTMEEVGGTEETGHDHRQLTAYVPLDNHGVKWALMVEQTIDEILEPARELAKTNAIQGAILTAIVAVLAFFVARAISKPLTRVEVAMRTVSEGSYDIEVPGVNRGDEIGQIANALDDFRHALGRAEQATQDGLFKGAAFEGSSAALMMIDQNFNITYMNSAIAKLFKDKEDRFRTLFPDFEATELVGKNIDVFHKKPEDIRAILGDPNKMPFLTDMKVADIHFALAVNSVVNEAGEQIGCVMEWNDVTEERTNEAVIDALDANQAKAEFHTDGTLLRANDNFSRMLSTEPSSLEGKMHTELFNFDPSLAKERGAIWDRLLAGENVHGRFKLLDQDGNISILDGTFSAVKDSSGQPFRIIVIGTDVTESRAALVVAEAERERMKADQDQVVEGLRVGLKRLANGDLTSRIEDRFADEYETLRGDYNAALDNLLSAMCNVVENADMIRGEASEISNAADDLSRRTEKQAATLEETATALDQLTTSVRSAAEGANQASSMVETAKSNAEASGKIVQEAVEAMSQIESSSNQITKITSVIDDIAFQTNLLALNAGVEAARAGEAGRGFAVVASEVRALAQRSSDAAREINELISKSGTLVKRGVSLVGETGDALRGIVMSVTDIASHVSEIAVSSREQSSGLAEINASVNQLDQVTQQNAAMFEETTAASHALTREAENLSVTTSQFSIGAALGDTSAKVEFVPAKLTATSSGESANEKGAPSAPAAAPATPSAPAAVREPVKQVVNAPAMSADVEDDDWEDF